MRITTFNVREVRGKETILKELMKHTDALRRSETWCSGGEIDCTAHMSVAINQRANNKNNRSFGEVALAINPALKYKKINKTALPKYQFVTVGLTGFTITACYISPSATSKTWRKP